MPKQTARFNFLLILLSLALAACAQSEPPAAPTLDAAELATIVAATLSAEPPLANATPSATPSPDADGILPAAVYFLSDRGGSMQVWRLAPDGETLNQLTGGEDSVDSFDVAADGQVAYVSGNQLWLRGSGGEAQLLVDGSAADPEGASFPYTLRVNAPRFAADGERLAYALNGVHVLNLDSGEDQQLLVNQLNGNDNDFVFPEELYSPAAWSPDGSRLLVSIAYVEGGRLGLLQPGGTPGLMRFENEGALCCQVAWSADGASVLVASPYAGIATPGLWAYDAASGAETVLLDDSDPNGGLHFAGWPQASGEDLFYFYASSAGTQEGDVPLFMVRSALGDLSDRKQLRPESFSIREALWAPDGSLALIIENPIVVAEGVTGGTILLVRADGGVAQPLAGQAHGLRWGP
jgi:Tol biopolymer transport system component